MSPTKTLIAAAPLFFIFLALVVALFVSNQSTENRSKASEPTPIITKVVLPSAPANEGFAPNSTCADLYQPVCGEDGKTYNSVCEANLQNIQVAHAGECN